MYFDGKHIGYEFNYYPINFLEQPYHCYYALDAYRTVKEAKKRPKVRLNKDIYGCEEYWWGDSMTSDDCGEAFFPTFKKVEDLVKYVGESVV